MESQTTEYKEQWHGKYLAYISSFGSIPRKMADQVNSPQLSDNEKKVFFFIKEFDRVNKQNDRENTMMIGFIVKQLHFHP